MKAGLFAELESAAAVVRAARSLRDAGYTAIDAYTPYPVHGLDVALGQRRSRIGYVVPPAGLAAAAGAYLLQWWTAARAYPIDVGGRPLHAALAFVPITFEATVLLSAFAAVGALLWNAGLPALWHPAFEAPGFEGASVDRFWIGVDARDPRFDRDRTARELEELGATRVAFVPRRDA
jgi:hypothetical protein